MIKRIQLLILNVLLSGVLFSQDVVTVDGRNILLNGEKYIIHGVCYSPVAKGDDRFDPPDFSKTDIDIQLMLDADINTIRTFVPITDPAVLDKFANAGIKIIMGIGNYDDTPNNYPDLHDGSYLTYIKTYKNHDAILMWELGNEYNYHPEWFNNNIDNWYTILNNAANAIHSADTIHPVSTAHGEVPVSEVFSKCPDVNVWGINVYRWDNPAGAITEFEGRSAKPFYFSESGGDRYNNNLHQEDQQDQADASIAIWNNIRTSFNVCSGITFFSWVDEWWKGGNNSIHDATGFSMSIPYDNYANEEWWGVVDIDRNTTLAYNTLKTAFNQYVCVSKIKPDEDFVIYPNPANNEISIRFSNVLNEQTNIYFYSMDGKLILCDQINTGTRTKYYSVNKCLMPKGLYLVVASGKGYIKQQMLIIE